MLASYICQRKVRHPLTGYNKNRQFMTQDGEGIQQLTLLMKNNTSQVFSSSRKQLLTGVYTHRYSAAAAAAADDC